MQSFFCLPTHKRLVKFSGFGVHPPTPSPKAVRVLELLPASILTNIQIQDVFSPCSSQILHHAPFAQRLTGIGILYRPSTSAALREQLMALCLCVCSYRTAKASAQAYNCCYSPRLHCTYPPRRCCPHSQSVILTVGFTSISTHGRCRELEQEQPPAIRSLAKSWSPNFS